MICFTKYDSPLGQFLLTAETDALTGLWMDTHPQGEMTRRDELPVFADARNWLDRYFAGDSPAPNEIPLCPAGTAFQRQVWEILLRIPYGETVTYGQIAKQIGGKSMSAQAVGQAVGRNPISIIIPCHRVVGVNRKLTGYAGGLDKKIWLLRHEGWLKEETP